MQKRLLLAALGCAAVTAFAADAPKQGTLQNVTRLTNDASTKFENPRFSPDGKQIAFTQLGFDGLYVMAADGSNMRNVSQAPGIGFMYQWSADCNQILVRDTRWEQQADGTLDRAHAAVAISIADGEATKLSADHPYMQPAAWRYAKNGQITIASDVEKIETRLAMAISPNMAASTLTLPQYSVTPVTDTDNLWILDQLGNKQLIYQGCALDPVVSPDGTRIAFMDMADDIHIINIDGTGNTIVGKGCHPAWLNNGQLVMDRTTDDGHTYLTGELVMLNLDNKAVKVLTSTPGHIEMNPSVSPDGNTIVFTDFNDGQVYKAEIR